MKQQDNVKTAVWDGNACKNVPGGCHMFFCIIFSWITRKKSLLYHVKTKKWNNPLPPTNNRRSQGSNYVCGMWSITELFKYIYKVCLHVHHDNVIIFAGKQPSPENTSASVTYTNIILYCWNFIFWSSINWRNEQLKSGNSYRTPLLPLSMSYFMPKDLFCHRRTLSFILLFYDWINMNISIQHVLIYHWELL